MAPTLNQTADTLTKLGIMSFALADTQVIQAARDFDLFGIFEALLAAGDNFINGDMFDQFMNLIKRVGIIEISLAVILALKKEIVSSIREGL